MINLKYLILAFSILITSATFAQQNGRTSKLNFDFEAAEKGSPFGWNHFGDPTYILALDSTQVRNGKYSAFIGYNEGRVGFKAWALTIPESYEGKKITLSGYIKTENVSDGYAGLWMRIDPSIALNNMNQNGIKGTTDWARYEITLNMNPDKTERIVFGGLLAGKGKMWLDDLKVTIDGKDIGVLKPLQRKLFLADTDKEFDKGSLITNTAVQGVQIANLKLLGMIWGFLKYHHPSIAGGDHNWDYELFRILPKVLSSKSANERDARLVEWINKLGAVSGISQQAVKSSAVKFEADLEWITKSGLSPQLSSILLKVKNTARTAEHYYIGFVPEVGNPEFKHEEAYSEMKYPDTGFRLLALFRYWNVIQYYFPYKNLIEEDWKDVLAEFIPKVVEAKDETQYTLTLLELIGRIHDTHANIWGNNSVLNNYFGLKYAPVELTFVEDKPIVSGFYDNKVGPESGLKIGDVITSINNKPVHEIVSERLKHSPASNRPTQLRDIAANLFRTNDSILPVEFLSDETTGKGTLKTFLPEEIKIRNKFQVTDTSFKFINKEIGYINNGSLKKQHLPKIWEGIKNTKGLIIDNRNYPSDFPIYDLSNYLLKQKTPFVKFTRSSIDNPGKFTFTEVLNAGRSNHDYYKGKVIVLVNEISQSSAEFHAMAYRVNPNTSVIGSTTAGADGNVSGFFLPGGIRTMISGIGVYYPDGRETQRIGILPDIEVKPTIRGIKEGRDELLEKAIEIINED